jgi:integrase
VNYWHKHYGPLASVPAIVMPPKPEPRDIWLSRKQAARLLWAARHTPHLARFILLGIYTGSRSGTILALRWEWIDLAAGVMRRKDPKESETKKRKPPVRLGRRILAHLRRWKRIDGRRCPLVCHYDGQPVQKMRRSWHTAVRRAKLSSRITPHTLRHTRATWLMQKNIDPWEAAGHLGMSVEMLTRVYGKHSPEFQKRAAEV